MRKPKSRSAFTLVELLVVIGIIAVLIGLLLPALSRAREQAVRVACLARMRQLGNACMLYANDNKGSFPPIWNFSDFPPVHFGRPAVFSTTNTPEYDCYLTKYLGKGNTAQLYICPALEANAGYSLTGGQSYRYNQGIGGYRPGNMLAVPNMANFYFANPWKIAQIHQSTQVALFLDTDTVLSGFGNGGNSMWFRQDASTLSGTQGASYHWPNMQGNFEAHAKYPPRGTYVGWNAIIDPVLVGSVNVIFCDGSARPVPFRVDSYPVKFQGSDGMYVEPDHPQPKW